MEIHPNNDLLCTAFLRMQKTQGKAFDENEFIDIYSRHHRQLQHVVFGFAKDRVMAEDIVQDVFMSVWERRGKMHIDSLPAYLTRSVKLAVFKSVAANKLHQKLIAQYYRPETIQWDEQVIYARFLEEYLSSVAEQLPEKCRMVFKYSRQQGLTIAEIAVIMSLSSKTVEAHLTRALRVLRLSLA